MKTINQVPILVKQLRQLSNIAKEVANASSPAEAEYFTIHYLRPALDETETILKELNTSRRQNSSGESA